METGRLATCLFGAAPDSGNRGVEALERSIVGGLRTATPRGSVTVFDNGWGCRPGESYDDLTVDYCGVRRSRRVHRSESWANVNLALRVPGLHNAVAGRIRSSDLVLDVSGGDSFSDTYGPSRLRTVLLPKLAALRAGRPLALLPQTYGPFNDPAAERRAAGVLRNAAVAWSRDDESLVLLQQLLGSEFDPQRHRRGVDVAFALEPRRPGDIPDWLEKLLDNRGSSPVVGVNISGLLDTRAHGFDISADYATAMRDTVTRLCGEAHVVLVPHVLGVAGEADRPAAERLRSRLAPESADRVHIAPEHWHAEELKWLISEFDWFCGARMHACIAALSTATPVCAIAYSRKFQGVFRTCGSEDLVLDARSLGTAEIAELALDTYARRDEIRQRLAATTPAIVDMAEQQIPTIVRTALAVASG